MNNLMEIERARSNTLSSIEAAEMIGREHKELLRSIRGYTEVLTSANLRPLEFFIPSDYIDAKREVRPCYLLTKKGCDMVANKMTGEKGIIFTAKYVTKFEEMESSLRENQPSLQDLSPQLQFMINMEQEQKKMQQQLNQVNHHALEAKSQAESAKQEIQGIRDVITLDHSQWREEVKKIVVSIAHKFGGNTYIQDVWKESYALLEQRGKTKLEIRLNNRRKNILAETGSKSKADKYTKLDVIGEEAKIRETFIAIVKEMAIKYGVA